MAPFESDWLAAGGDAMPRPHGDSYWVVPGRLLAGSHPALHLDALLAAGIGTFVDLTHSGSTPSPYAVQMGERARWHGFAIVDFGTPGEALMRDILAAIDAALAEERRVYVHCHAGVGRTGTAVGCWLVQQGLSGEAALAAIAAKRSVVSRLALSPRSPETEAQREFVRRWPARVARP
ncbi:MAG: dual specificity protein phosphatase family protein [Burkholderiaceae bacterium]